GEQGVETLTAHAPASALATAASALLARHTGDPWAEQRAAELLARAGSADAADAAHASGLHHADDATVRRELVARWSRAVGHLTGETQLVLRTRAAERA